jgi:tRNA threonylcarbamoyladenosine biosynthesis protein TsaB
MNALKNNIGDAWLLALETTGKSGSASIGCGGRIRATRSATNESRSACSLAPSIQSLLDEVVVKSSQLACIAVTVGPGSFTGLRVGVATAKTLAFALGIPTVEVDTLHTIAWQVQRWAMREWLTPDNLPFTQFWTIMDAFRGELFVALWQLNKDWELSCLKPSKIMTVSDWVAAINQPETTATEANNQSSPFIAGPGLSRCNALLRDEIVRVPNHIGDPNSESVFALGWDKLLRGQTTDADQLLPNYLRQSAAEEKRQSQP